MIEIVLARHAQPEWEPGGQAVDNPELTELGRRQAQQLADWVREQHFDAFYSSTLVRCRQTSEPVARALGQEPTFLSWLEEIRLPSLEGQPSEQVHRYLRDARARNLDEWWEGAPGGESFRHFHERITGGIEPLLTGTHRAEVHAEDACRLWRMPPEDSRILIVAHAGTIAVLLSFLLGIEPVPWEWERFRVGWCGVSFVKSVAIGNGALWAMTGFNSRVHLAGLPDPPG